MKKTTPETGEIIVGRKPVLETVESSPERVEAVYIQKGTKGSQTDRIIDICRAKNIRFRLATKQEVDRLYQGNHQGVAALVAPKGFIELEELMEEAFAAPLKLIIALDQVQDPGNVGTLARTLYALGGAGIIMPKHGGARLGIGATKASAGALDKLPISRVTNLSQALDKCLEQGFNLYCAAYDPDAPQLYDMDLEFPAVLVLGNEEKGVRPNVAKRCHGKLAIPMARDFDSLNVAQAGAILISQFSSRSLK